MEATLFIISHWLLYSSKSLSVLCVKNKNNKLNFNKWYMQWEWMCKFLITYTFTNRYKSICLCHFLYLLTFYSNDLRPTKKEVTRHHETYILFPKCDPAVQHTMNSVRQIYLTSKKKIKRTHIHTHTHTHTHRHMCMCMWERERDRETETENAYVCVYICIRRRTRLYLE